MESHSCPVDQCSHHSRVDDRNGEPDGSNQLSKHQSAPIATDESNVPSQQSPDAWSWRSIAPVSSFCSGHETNASAETPLEGSGLWRSDLRTDEPLCLLVDGKLWGGCHLDQAAGHSFRHASADFAEHFRRRVPFSGSGKRYQWALATRTRDIALCLEDKVNVRWAIPK